MKYYITILKRMQIGQDGGKEGPWAHLLSQHTKITTICTTTIDEKDLNQAEKIFHHQRHKEGTAARRTEEANSWYNQLGWATHKLEKNCITEVPPHEWQSQAHTLGSPAQESCTRNTAPRAFGFEGQQGLTSGAPTGSGQIKTWLLFFFFFFGEKKRTIQNLFSNRQTASAGKN